MVNQRAEGRSRAQTKAAPTHAVAYQLHIVLVGIEPPIWRQILVPGRLTLFGLHECLQVIMGWQNYHLHQFTIGTTLYSVPDPEGEIESTDDRRIRLQRVAPQIGERFGYEYDFGDSWRHQITVEAVLPQNELMIVPSCLDGKRACPPEDCGGVGGYARLLEALRDRRHPEHRTLREWAGPHFDPQVFSLQAVNSALAVLQAYVLR